MAKTDSSTGYRPSGDMLTAHLLALLRGWTAYGYDLVQRLEDAGYGDFNKGSIYRTLRQMERLGLVSSDWDTSTDGPARRMYTVTQLGLSFLTDWLAVVDAHRRDLDMLMGVQPTKQEPRGETSQNRTTSRS